MCWNVRLLLGLAFLGAVLGCARDPEAAPPEEVIRLNVLGTAHLGQLDWSDAEASFREALALRPTDPLLLTNLAVALVQQRRTEEATRLLEQALGSDPDYPYAHYNLGLIQEATGEFESAAGHFRAVAETDPDDLLTLYYLGTTQARLGRDEEAERALRAALERDPTHISSLYGLGRLLLKSGDREEGARLITLSQQIRERSGLDTTVGGQYGEQGPYGMGIDYPGDVLAAPQPIPVRYSVAARAAISPEVRWTLAPLGPRNEPTLILTGGAGLVGLTPAGPTEIAAPPLPSGARVIALTAGDFDNDRRADLATLIAAGDATALAILRQDEEGEFRWRGDGPGNAPLHDGGPAVETEIAAVDRDHDGDLDLFWCRVASGGSTAGCSLATNDGSGLFRITPGSEHGITLDAAERGPLRVAFSDTDNDRDIDLLVAGASGIRLFSNVRDGTFEEISEARGLGSARLTDPSFAVADLNKDGFMDLLAGGQLLWNRRGQFDSRGTGQAGASPGAVGPRGGLVVDFDNDGFLDIAGAADGALALERNLGRGAWDRIELDIGPVALDRLLAAYDADGDGDLEIAARIEDGVVLLSNEGGNAHRFIELDSRGVGDNRFGIGAKVEVLAGALRQKFELTAPLPLHVGLGSRGAVQSVRYVWPGGVLQDEIELAAGARVEVAQVDRKGTSCPLLYAWRDGSWRFVTDLLGGSAIGYRPRPDGLSVPDTDEYVRIEGGLSEDAEGRLRVRLNNQLEEVIWFDQTELVTVDHPAGTEVYPNERLMPGPPWPEFKLFASADVRPIRRAIAVESGADLGDLLREADRRWVADFELLPFKGYASFHTIELDLGPFPEAARVVLLLDGWIDYADSSANVAAAQAGHELVPPRLAVADGRGDFRRTDGVMGFPAGLPKTMAVELTGLFASADHRVRIGTNMRVYWDRARVMLGGESTEMTVRRLAPSAAELRFGGYPRPTSPDGRKPEGYDPDSVGTTHSWKAHVGSYTPFGDVTGLLLRIDDRFVTTRNGDEIELVFPSPGPLPPNRERTFLLYADGFGKDMDPNSAASETVGPVPFHGMPLYPYPPEISRPASAASGRAGRAVLPSDAGWPGAIPQPLARGR